MFVRAYLDTWTASARSRLSCSANGYRIDTQAAGVKAYQLQQVLGNSCCEDVGGTCGGHCRPIEHKGALQHNQGVRGMQHMLDCKCRGRQQHLQRYDQLLKQIHINEQLLAGR